MKNKIFMTIGGAVAALCPWVTHAETFPSDGNMLENKTYESAATYSNLGTYEGTVSATAEYADILYQVGAGQYLPAGSEGVGAACTAGYYCPGLTDVTYNATNDQGRTACPNGYPNSESGARMNTQCYTPCTDKSVIAHATAVAGNDYYGNGVDTCYATACDNGYHTYNGIEMVEQDSLIGVDTSLAGSNYGYISANGSYKEKESYYGLTANNTWAASFSYGIVYGQASCQSSVSDEILGFAFYSGMNGNTASTVEDFRSGMSQYVDDAATLDAVVDAYAQHKAGTIDMVAADKIVYALLSMETDADFSTTDSGQYCFCQMTSFTQSGQSGSGVAVTSAPWVFRYDFGSADNCAGICARYCAGSMQDDVAGYRGFRAAVLGSLGARTVGVCAANEISITWADADAADVAANNAGVCTYDGDIRTPARAITKPGKTFKGWRFSK